MAQHALVSPQNLRVIDTPSEAGGGLTVLWSKADYDAPDVRYQILIMSGDHSLPQPYDGNQAR